MGILDLIGDDDKGLFAAALRQRQNIGHFSVIDRRKGNGNALMRGRTGHHIQLFVRDFFNREAAVLRHRDNLRNASADRALSDIHGIDPLTVFQRLKSGVASGNQIFVGLTILLVTHIFGAVFKTGRTLRDIIRGAVSFLIGRTSV